MAAAAQVDDQPEPTHVHKRVRYSVAKENRTVTTARFIGVN
jgi:hypothetical protein